MAYSTPFTATAGAVLTAAIWNVIRDDLNYHQGLLDGTGSGTVTVPGDLQAQNDAHFRMTKIGGFPYLEFDTNDQIAFDRTSNIWYFFINSVAMLNFTSDGKLQGKGFYDSGEVSTLNGGNGAVNHGLGARPRVVFLYYSTTGSGTADSKTLLARPGGSVDLNGVTSTQITWHNGFGSTIWANAYAIL